VARAALAAPPDSSAGAVEPRLRQPALRVRELGYRIGTIDILRDVSFDVAPGGFCSVIGPNGAGKTTLFDLLTGTRRPSTGDVWLLGAPVTTTSPARRARAGLARSFQTASVFETLPVIENAWLAARGRAPGNHALWRRPRRDRAALGAAAAALDAVGLGALAALPAAALSHGDRRKLEVALLLAGDAAVLLLDEPTAGLGAEDVEGIVELVSGLHTRHGRTIVMVEHRIDLVRMVSQEVLVLAAGRVIAHGPTAQALADPAVRAAYLGDEI
jgi:branched-chain amino acid transport system ATP-binding protein